MSIEKIVTRTEVYIEDAQHTLEMIKKALQQWDEMKSEELAEKKMKLLLTLTCGMFFSQIQSFSTYIQENIIETLKPE